MGYAAFIDISNKVYISQFIMDILQILSITLSLVVLVSVLEFIRRGVFKEKYALLWLFSSIALIIISLWRGLLDFTAGIFGFYYPPSFLFLICLGVKWTLFLSRSSCVRQKTTSPSSSLLPTKANSLFVRARTAHSERS